MSQSVAVLVPIAITDASLSSASVAEPAAGEVAWVSAGTYALGDRRIRASTHRVYSALVAHSGRSALPEADVNFWNDEGPTLRWGAFDQYISTPSTSVTSMTYVIRPGFFNALVFYGLVGASLTVSIKDAPGGSVYFTYSEVLENPVEDWYEWLFSPPKAITRLLISGILPQADAEVTITIGAATGTAVGVGMLVLGDLKQLVGDGELGGTQFGATAEPQTYSYIKTEFDGTVRIKRRHKATDMRLNVLLPQAYADYALSIIQDVLDVPCAVIGTNQAGYQGLNVFGLISGTLTYAGPKHANFSLIVKGFI